MIEEANTNDNTNTKCFVNIEIKRTFIKNKFSRHKSLKQHFNTQVDHIVDEPALYKPQKQLFGRNQDELPMHKMIEHDEIGQ